MFRPLNQSFYTGIEHVYAGEYPGDKDEEKARAKIQQMILFGVRHFVDLTGFWELRPYVHLLPTGTTHTRFPIQDCGVPNSVDDVYRLLNKIKDLLKQDDGIVFIHCWGGVGRTGTIVACYIAEEMENPTFETVMKRLRDSFLEMPKAAHRVTPDTKEQEEFIRKYIESKLERTGQGTGQSGKLDGFQKPKFKVLMWQGTHFTAKFDQASFPKGYLNVWLEYSDVNAETVRRQTEGFVSGFKLIAIRNKEFGESGTNIIYQIAPENYVPIPRVDFTKGESVFGIQDFDFNCMMKVSFRPSLDSVDGLIPLYEWEI